MDGLDGPGTLYRVKIVAVNEDGLKSPDSNECLFALGALPSKPNVVRKNDQRSSGLAIFVEWDKITTDTLPILGYKLYADSGKNDPLRLVYDGSTNPQITEFEYMAFHSLNETIETALFYRFRVAAVNFNGEGEMSDFVSLQSCTVPSQLPAPTVVSISSSTVSISWEAPVNDGGCSITSYHIYLGELDSQNWSEVDPAEVTNKPFLTQYNMDMSMYTVGEMHSIYLTVDNKVGTATSDTVVFLLADVPGQPEPPTRESDGTYLKVIMAAPSTDGGSQITNYQL